MVYPINLSSVSDKSRSVPAMRLKTITHRLERFFIRNWINGRSFCEFVENLFLQRNNVMLYSNYKT